VGRVRIVGGHKSQCCCVAIPSEPADLQRIIDVAVIRSSVTHPVNAAVDQDIATIQSAACGSGAASLLAIVAMGSRPTGPLRVFIASPWAATSRTMCAADLTVGEKPDPLWRHLTSTSATCIGCRRRPQGSGRTDTYSCGCLFVWPATVASRGEPANRRASVSRDEERRSPYFAGASSQRSGM
jgi:hypothetical protein